MDEFIMTALETYMQDPSHEHFLQLRSAVLNSPHLDPDGDYRRKTSDLLGQEKFQEAYDTLMSMMPDQLLSPGSHSLAGFALQQMGQDPGFEYVLGNMLVKSILSSADGSEAHPYLVLHVCDEYHLLRLALKKNPVGQSLRGDIRGQAYDVIQCDDGTEVWFDITDLMRKRREALEKTQRG